MLRIKLTHANEHMQKAASCVNLNAIGTKKKSASSPSNAYYEKSAHTHTLTNPDSDNKIKFYESEKEIEKKTNI